MLKEKIKQARKNKNLTQKELSEIGKIPISLIKTLEREEKINDKVALLRIIRILNLDPILIFSYLGDDYKDLKKKNQIFFSDKNSIKTIYCGSWESFYEYYFENIFEKSDKNYIWRGHKNSNWKLESTLLREYPEGIDDVFIDLLVKKFKKSTLGNKERIEIEKLITSSLSDEMLWLSLGQHYGLKTPLLDWTTSPYVASFFAFLEKNDSTPFRVLYALNKKKLKDLAELLGESIKIVEIENHFNKRLINQQGLFLYGPFEKDLETFILENNIFKCNENDPILYKFLIPESDRKKILKLLNKMNVNPKSLFPDLIGASINANFEIEIEI